MSEFDIFKLDTSRLQSQIRNHHSQYDFPVKDLAAENILVNFFEDNGYVVWWEQGSHRPGADVFVCEPDRVHRGWSVKSAKEPMNGEWLKISSYRTESWPALADKIEAIKRIESDIAGYVIFARVESKVRKQPICRVCYATYCIDPSVLSINSFKFQPEPDEDGNFSGVNDLGVKLFIAKTMSSQVWYSVPMTMIRDGALVKPICKAGPFEMKLRHEPDRT